MILACGTLSYRQKTLGRALEGIARAGFRWIVESQDPSPEAIDHGVRESYLSMKSVGLEESR
ncbi:MAG: hypothetical protein HUU20_15390 [Pirellulales bacterium]|nr:hypothetical protein [Pirellulales bacterium]